MDGILFSTIILILISNFNYIVADEEISTVNIDALEHTTTPEPFLCPDIDCDSPECHHLERSGLCEDVVNGTLEITRENCGCCFICADDVGEYLNACSIYSDPVHKISVYIFKIV